MAEKYIISIDQSTQGTKALLFDGKGTLLNRMDLAHRQIINGQGWVSHDPEEIYQNTVQTVKNLIELSGIDKRCVMGIGISNQRETSLVWDRKTGEPIADAVVWQCTRAADVCERVRQSGMEQTVKEKTGLELSPYFPASKIAWLLENVDGAAERAAKHELCFGTIDTWLVYKLTGGREYRTDYSNASRTQLFNIFSLQWDEEICRAFGICPEDLAQVCDSDGLFGKTDFEGYFPQQIPIHSVFGDSHGALFGQGCLHKGMIKATYGTGSSIMMNIGEKPVLSTHGVVTSLAWGIGGKVSYVLEGNINYTGAVISWLKNDVRLIQSPEETEEMCDRADKNDSLYLVPAFTGLGAPYWDSYAKGVVTGITRTTGKEEIVRAAVECIAYQIMDVTEAMERDADVKIRQLRVDGGPTGNKYLMQFQSDILKAEVFVPDSEELSGIGAAYAAGLALHIYTEEVFDRIKRRSYQSEMEDERREKKYAGWKAAVQCSLAHGYYCCKAI